MGGETSSTGTDEDSDGTGDEAEATTIQYYAPPITFFG